jgi:hypothetical protein
MAPAQSTSGNPTHKARPSQRPPLHSSVPVFAARPPTTVTATRVRSSSAAIVQGGTLSPAAAAAAGLTAAS